MNKKMYLVVLSLLLCSIIHGHEQGEIVLEENIIQSNWMFPITDEVASILLSSTKELDCDLESYFEMWGATPASNAEYKLKNDMLKLKCSFKNADLIMLFIVDIKDDLMSKKLSSEEIKNKYIFRKK